MCARQVCVNTLGGLSELAEHDLRIEFKQLQSMHLNGGLYSKETFHSKVIVG